MLQTETLCRLQRSLHRYLITLTFEGLRNSNAANCTSSQPNTFWGVTDIQALCLVLARTIVLCDILGALTWNCFETASDIAINFTFLIDTLEYPPQITNQRWLTSKAPRSRYPRIFRQVSTFKPPSNAKRMSKPLKTRHAFPDVFAINTFETPWARKLKRTLQEFRPHVSLRDCSAQIISKPLLVLNII